MAEYWEKCVFYVINKCMNKHVGFRKWDTCLALCDSNPKNNPLQ